MKEQVKIYGLYNIQDTQGVKRVISPNVIGPVSEYAFENSIKVMLKYGRDYFQNPEECFKKEGIELYPSDLEIILKIVEEINKLNIKDMSTISSDFNEKLVLCSSSGY